MEVAARSKKQRLAAALDFARVFDVAERLQRRRNYITILGYHRILEIDPRTYPYDEDIVSASPDEFDRQMSYVRAHFDVMTFEELAVALRDDRVPKRALLITFDDGYRDNYAVALPILRRHGLRAIVYVATGYVGGIETFWYEKIAYWMKASRRPAVQFGPSGTVLPLGDRRVETLGHIRTTLKLADEIEHPRLMAQLAEQMDVPLEHSHLVATMTWDEIREMHAQGTEIGAHTVSHLNMAKIGPERLEREVRDSKAAIERETGTRVVSLAYPMGGRAHHNEAVKQMVRAAGFDFGVSYIEGINPLDSFDRYALRRIHVERNTAFTDFKAALQFPGIFVRE